MGSPLLGEDRLPCESSSLMENGSILLSVIAHFMNVKGRLIACSISSKLTSSLGTSPVLVEVEDSKKKGYVAHFPSKKVIIHFPT